MTHVRNNGDDGKSLFDAMGEREKDLSDKERNQQYIDEGVEYLRPFAAQKAGNWPWANYVRPGLTCGHDNPAYIRALIDLNRLPLAPRIVPLPSQQMDARMQSSFDQTAMEDMVSATLHPMIATSLLMYTPSLLMLFMANSSKKYLEEIRDKCLEVARRWRACGDDDKEERARLVQNLVILQDLYASEQERLKREAVSEREWPVFINAPNVIAHYRRLMNIIRYTRGFAGIDETHSNDMEMLIERTDRRMANEIRRLMRADPSDPKATTHPIEELLKPLTQQIQSEGVVSSLSEVDVVRFQKLQIDFTVAFIQVMERWLLRITGPNIPSPFYYYHLYSNGERADEIMLPDQQAAATIGETMMQIRNTNHMATKARHARAPYMWPEFHRSTNLLNTPAVSMQWPKDRASLPLPYMDRIATATSMVACARALAKSYHLEQCEAAAIAAFEVLSPAHNYQLRPWNESQWCLLMPSQSTNEQGEEIPIVFAGLPDVVFQ